MMDRKQHSIQYKWGVALSGGGARGFAHLGAMQALYEKGIQPEIFSGTSAGSLAGAFLADGYTPEEVFAIFKAVKFTDIIATTLPQEGLFKTTGIQTLLKKKLRAKRFEDLKIPLRVVASDIERGKPHIFDSGELIPAVVASCSVPIVFTPMEIDGRHYVDGGVFLNLPVSVIRQACWRVVAIDISPVITMKYDKSLKYIIERTMNYMVGANTVEEIKLCDYLIASDEVSQYSLFDLKHAEEIYQKGYEMAVVSLEKHQKKWDADIRKPIPAKWIRHTRRLLGKR
ncbi:NTE family protein [Parabacteroides sp. PFB2-12]|uniref:patatin-like phospholipase family protein n=1 Tax=unclassified Parabacteroides TaxID=2649774 RepID=UPI0024736C13|nr:MULTISPECIES: patatin-like phospholipase family protein [unclassified Parabacteroides]MDH6341986.1 NTE family protein [Parabacteroides sp. PM6-13]MDH6389684.1 NTE family protein [Parabacteroides sp. PFB2-12]